MKKKKKNSLFKFIFCILLFSFTVVYFSELTGYYEYQNYKKSNLTQEQIRKYEQDIKDGKKIDVKEYLTVENNNYSNKLSSITSKLSDGISDVVKSGVTYTFKFLSRLIDE